MHAPPTGSPGGPRAPPGSPGVPMDPWGATAKKEKYVFVSPQSFLNQIEQEIQKTSCAIEADSGCLFGTSDFPPSQNCPKLPKNNDPTLSSICCHGGNNPMFITFVNGEGPDNSMTNENPTPFILESIQKVPYFIPYLPVISPPTNNKEIYMSQENYTPIEETKLTLSYTGLYLFLIFYVLVFIALILVLCGLMFKNEKHMNLTGI